MAGEGTGQVIASQRGQDIETGPGRVCVKMCAPVLACKLEGRKEGDVWGPDSATFLC